MKTEHYNELEKKFYLGETTPEEEQFLKEQDNDGIFSILKEEKKETMDWDFDDFLAQAETINTEETKEATIIPLANIQKKKNYQQYTWIAASLVLLFGAYIAWNSHNTDINTQDQTIAKEISNQKEIFEQENNIAAKEEEQNIVENNNKEVSTKNTDIKPENTMAETDVLDEILPKKGRIKKQSKPIYTSTQTNTKKETTTVLEYQPNYVIINGQKITDEKEALEVTKYSMQMLSNKVSKTIANTVTLDHSTDY